jgi:hypothetical protein
MPELLNNSFNSWSSFLLIFSCAMIVLYLARHSAHGAILGLSNALHSMLRVCSKSLSLAGKRLQERNREVLLNVGREHTEREIEKEFYEVSKFVQKDLGDFPEMQREIQSQIQNIQEAYEGAKSVASESPGWLEAIESVSKIKDSNAQVNHKVLEQIKTTAEKQHKENLRALREDSAQRHKMLRSMQPFWRKLSHTIEQGGRRFKDIIERSEKIDTHMQRYEEIQAGTDGALRYLKLSAMTQFLISTLVIAIAAGGAFFNFHLIALPMSEMVGSVQRVGGVKVSDLAALVIICLEMCAGIFLLESLRITKLFPLIGAMDDRKRRTVMILSAVVLLTLACTESALAFMRDQIANEISALRASLAGSLDSGIEQESSLNHWIPLAANMILGFILPLALTMIAIPLEYLLQSGRTVLGSLIELVANTIAMTLRMSGNLVRHAGKILVNIYDLLIAGPIWLEAVIQNRLASSRENSSESDWLENTLSGGTASVNKSSRGKKS